MESAGGNEFIYHTGGGGGEGFHRFPLQAGIVSAALGFITQHIVGFLDRRKKERIAAFIRMVPDRQRAVSSADRIVFGISRYAKGLVVSQGVPKIDGFARLSNG